MYVNLKFCQISTCLTSSLKFNPQKQPFEGKAVDEKDGKNIGSF